MTFSADRCLFSKVLNVSLLNVLFENGDGY